MFNPWPVVAADLRRSRIGVVAVMLLVALAVGLGVAVSAQERALRQGSAQAADRFDVIIGAPGSETQLLLSSVYLQPAAVNLIDGRILTELAADPEVAFAAPLGFGDNYRGHPIVGTTAAFVDHAAGPALTEGRVFERIDEVVIGAAVPLEMGDSFVPIHGQVEDDPDAVAHRGFTYRVVGRMPRLGNPWDAAIISPIEAVWWIHTLPVGHVVDHDAVWPAGMAGEPDLGAIPLGPPWDVEELPGVPAIVASPVSIVGAYTLRQRYRNRDDTNAIFPAEVLIQLYSLLGNVRDLVAMISILTQALVIGAILLAVLASLAQRRKLIAVLRALGASRSYVFTTIWLNVAVMLTLGAVLGLGIGLGGAHLLSWMVEAETYIALPVTIAWQEVQLVIAIVVIGLALATIPAALTYRSSVSAALRA